MMKAVSTPKRKHRPTIVDIAAHCGVAKATVSKALAPIGRYSLSDDVRRRVSQTVQTLGYRPGPHGRSAKLRLVALLYSRPIHPNPVDQSTQHMLAAATAMLLSRGYHFVHVPRTDDLTAFRDLLESRRIQAWMVTSPLDTSAAQWLRESSLPHLVLNAPTNAPLSQLICDHHVGSQRVAEHLRDLGHVSVAIHCAAEPTLDQQSRRITLLSALRQSNPSTHVSAISDPAQFIEHWRAMRPRATAVIADTLAGAVELLHFCWRAGIAVPRDLSVISLEDGPLAEKLIPPLTTLTAPAEQMGQQAATLLVDQIEGRQSSEPRRICFHETLTVRESSAATSA